MYARVTRLYHGEKRVKSRKEKKKSKDNKKQHCSRFQPV